LKSNHIQYPACSLRQDVSEYVADLQLHMALHARKLVPSFNEAKDGRQELLQETQAQYEKLISRQTV
jgi:hypothetical protein